MKAMLGAASYGVYRGCGGIVGPQKGAWLVVQGQGAMREEWEQGQADA